MFYYGQNGVELKWFIFQKMKRTFEIYATYNQEKALYDQGKIVVLNEDIGMIYAKTLITGTTHADHNVFVEQCVNWDAAADQFESRLKQYESVRARQDQDIRVTTKQIEYYAK